MAQTPRQVATFIHTRAGDFHTYVDSRQFVGEQIGDKAGAIWTRKW